MEDAIALMRTQYEALVIVGNNQETKNIKSAWGGRQHVRLEVMTSLDHVLVFSRCASDCGLDHLTD